MPLAKDLVAGPCIRVCLANTESRPLTAERIAAFLIQLEGTLATLGSKVLHVSTDTGQQFVAFTILATAEIKAALSASSIHYEEV